jgi:hypothetical protein
MEYSPYNLKACPTSNDKCKCVIITIPELNNLILSDHTSNSIFRVTWMSFKGCIDQFDHMHANVKLKRSKELLLDFYKHNYLKSKDMKTRLTEYFSFDKEKECIIKCNVDEIIDKFLVIIISHINTLS